MLGNVLFSFAKSAARGLPWLCPDSSSGEGPVKDSFFFFFVEQEMEKDDLLLSPP